MFLVWRRIWHKKDYLFLIFCLVRLSTLCFCISVLSSFVCVFIISLKMRKFLSLSYDRWIAIRRNIHSFNIWRAASASYIYILYFFVLIRLLGWDLFKSLLYNFLNVLLVVHEYTAFIPLYSELCALSDFLFVLNVWKCVKFLTL